MFQGTPNCSSSDFVSTLSCVGLLFSFHFLSPPMSPRLSPHPSPPGNPLFFHSICHAHMSRLGLTLSCERAERPHPRFPASAGNPCHPHSLPSRTSVSVMEASLFFFFWYFPFYHVIARRVPRALEYYTVHDSMICCLSHRGIDVPCICVIPSHRFMKDRPSHISLLGLCHKTATPL